MLGDKLWKVSKVANLSKCNRERERRNSYALVQTSIPPHLENCRGEEKKCWTIYAFKMWFWNIILSSCLSPLEGTVSGFKVL